MSDFVTDRTVSRDDEPDEKPANDSEAIRAIYANAKSATGKQWRQ